MDHLFDRGEYSVERYFRGEICLARNSDDCATFFTVKGMSECVWIIK